MEKKTIISEELKNEFFSMKCMVSISLASGMVMEVERRVPASRC